LKNKLERKTAKEIALGNWTVLVNADEYVIGWKVAKELPSWVNNSVAWEGFVIDIETMQQGPKDSHHQKKVSVMICLLILRGLEQNEVWLPTWMTVMMLGRKRRPFMKKKNRTMRKMKNRMLMKLTRQKMRKKKSKKIAKLVRRQKKTRNTCPLILMTLMKKVM
jgi:hypothetical protein